MRETRSRDSQRAEFLRDAEAMYERMMGWEEKHPEASFDEMANQVGAERRLLMGQLLKQLASQRAAAVEATEVLCPDCGEKAEGKGQKKREISHREGELSLTRGYRHCAECGRGFFPPGPETEAGEAQLESRDSEPSSPIGRGDSLI